MTASEKLDLIIQRIAGLEKDINDVKSDLKKQLMRFTAELKAMDSLILDEVERVHKILDRHKADTTAHKTA